MTQEEILQFNKMCAEILDFTFKYYTNDRNLNKQSPNITFVWGTQAKMFRQSSVWWRCSKTPENNFFWYFPNDLKFHSDWNWIMEVVEAIERLKGFSVYIGKNRMNKLHSVEISYEDNTWEKRPHIDKTIFIQNESKKEAVVQAINQFLIWYNENQRN